MRLFSREATQYASLLLLLFAIAAIAVGHTLSLLADHTPEASFKALATSICAITFGFMMIAGAFGLWAIEFAGQAEARRRISQLVNTMSFLSDGLISVDNRRRITASNAAAQKLTTEELKQGIVLDRGFSCLSQTDIEELLASAESTEIERLLKAPSGKRLLRFRALPAEGLTLILISDVTSLEAKRESTRQSARLQLIGEIARGMAHDVNTLLCTISGYTSLLKKYDTGSAGFDESLKQISRGVEKGTALAGRLIELTRPIAESGRTPMNLDNIRTGLDRLRESLQSDLSVTADLEEIPPVALTGIRIEQIIFNLGLLLINPEDPAPELYVRACVPGGDHAVLSPGDDSGGIVLMASRALASERLDELVPAKGRDEGVIISVLSTMIRQSSGRLDIFSDSHGDLVYRICLAPATGMSSRAQEHSYVTELGPYFQNWSLLIAAYGAVLKEAEARMKSLNIGVHRAGSLASLLSTIENGTRLDAIIIQEALISEETGGIIKAILKLTPGAAVVLLQSGTENGNIQKLEQDVVVMDEDTSLDQIMLSLIEAKALAVRRSQATLESSAR